MYITAEIVFTILVLTIVVILSFMRRRPAMPKESFANFVGTKPVLWWVVDDDINARQWLDFGGRNTRECNRGYLTVALDAVRKTQGDEFDIRPLYGRKAVIDILPNANIAAQQLPASLWRHYVAANLLDTYGGLVMDANSTLCIGPSFTSHVKNVDAAVFGITRDEPIVSPTFALAPGPSPYVTWSRRPKHPAWTYAASVWNTLVATGPQAWSSAEARRTYMTVFVTQKTSYGIQVLRTAEGSRKSDGRLLELEDLFGRAHTSMISFAPDTVYVAYDGDALLRNYEFNWFLRLSPDQIKSSNSVWAKLAGFY